MQRRLVHTVLAAAAALFVTAAAARAQTIELKVSHYLPPNHQIQGILESWAADLAKQSGGRLKLTIFPAGQMGPPPRQFDLARTGVADISYFIHGLLPGRFPLTETAHLPLAFSRGQGATATTLSTEAASGILTELSEALSAEHEGTKPLFFIATPTLGLFFNKGGVRSPADMRGMRVRHNGPVAAQMVEAWGAAPAAIPPAEISDALAKGTIGGMVFNFEAARSFQMAGSVKSVLPLQSASGTFALVMNAEKYKSLPADLRKLIDDTTGPAMARKAGKIFDAAEDEGQRYLEAAKVEIVKLSPAERAAFEDPIKPIVAATLAKGGPAAKAVYDQIRAKVESAK
jgi:TRAP-type transport system periplasmic protein